MTPEERQLLIAAAQAILREYADVQTPDITAADCVAPCEREFENGVLVGREMPHDDDARARFLADRADTERKQASNPSSQDVNECPSCKRMLRDGDTCGRGGCPMGRDF